MLEVIYNLRKSKMFDNVSIGDEKQLQRTLEDFTSKNPTFKLHTFYIDSFQSVHFIFEVENNFQIINNGKNTFAVLSAWHNGISDRTTYSGLHRGDYDLSSIERAIEVAELRCRGAYKSIAVYHNLEKELHFIPNKYKHMIASDSYYGGREDGYWIYLTEGYFNDEMGCQTIHEYTQKQVLKVLRSSRPITEQDKLNANYK